MADKKVGLMNWSPEREKEFRTAMEFGPGYKDWRASFQRRFGEQPNLDDPMYNYRAAWQAGAVPTPYENDQGFPHWPSSAERAPFAEPIPLKSKDHPTAWMETFMRQYGVDPYQASSEQLGDAQKRGIISLWNWGDR